MKLTANQARLLFAEHLGFRQSVNTRCRFNNPQRLDWQRLRALGLVDSETRLTDAGRAHVTRLLAVEVPEVGPSLRGIAALPNVTDVTEIHGPFGARYVSLRGWAPRLFTNDAEGRKSALAWAKNERAAGLRIPKDSELGRALTESAQLARAEKQAEARTTTAAEDKFFAAFMAMLDAIGKAIKDEDEETRVLRKLRAHPLVKSVAVHRAGDGVRYDVAYVRGGIAVHHTAGQLDRLLQGLPRD